MMSSYEPAEIIRKEISSRTSGFITGLPASKPIATSRLISSVVIVSKVDNDLTEIRKAFQNCLREKQKQRDKNTSNLLAWVTSEFFVYLYFDFSLYERIFEQMHDIKHFQIVHVLH